MTKIKLLSIAVIGLILINLVLLTFLFLRKPPPHPPDRQPPLSERRGPAEMIIKELHFDKDQVSQYEKLIDVHKNTIKELDDSIRITKNDLYKTLENDNTSEKDSLVNRLSNLQKQIETVHYDHFADIKKICRPDQINYFNELISKLAEFFSPKKGPPPHKDPKDL
ncbi:MAG: hypothetical protein R3A12_09035 [Ignavibacteria bacterium]